MRYGYSNIQSFRLFKTFVESQFILILKYKSYLIFHLMQFVWPIIQTYYKTFAEHLLHLLFRRVNYAQNVLLILFPAFEDRKF